MPDSNQQLKQRLRSQCREVLARLSPTEIAEHSHHICTNIDKIVLRIPDQKLAGFWSIGVEPNIRPFLRSWLKESKELVLPRFQPDTKIYELAQVKSLENDLSAGQFNVFEPKSYCAHQAKFSENDVILVPGLGFSPLGHRLGRGKGYYDKILANFPGLKIGIAFDCQILPSIPADKWDVSVDVIITQSNVYSPDTQN